MDCPRTHQLAPTSSAGKWGVTPGLARRGEASRRGEGSQRGRIVSFLGKRGRDASKDSAPRPRPRPLLGWAHPKDANLEAWHRKRRMEAKEETANGSLK